MTPGIRLGLRENLGQFSLLVLVNAFVGAMVGMARTIVPAIAEQEFRLAAVPRSCGSSSSSVSRKPSRTISPGGSRIASAASISLSRGGPSPSQ